MKQVLHLEDNLEYQKQVREIVLEIDKNTNVQSSSDLESAIHTFETETPNLIITDYCLVPQTRNRDGLEFVKYIRSRNDVPIIMYSSGNNAIEEMALEEGVNHFVDKDDLKSLRKVLEEYLGGKNELCI